MEGFFHSRLGYHWESFLNRYPAMSNAPEKSPAEKVQTIADFLRVLRACGLVEPERLEPVIAPWRDATGPLPEELPAALIDADLLTQWQLDQLRKGKHKGFMLGKYRLRLAPAA